MTCSDRKACNSLKWARSKQISFRRRKYISKWHFKPNLKPVEIVLHLPTEENKPIRLKSSRHRHHKLRRVCSFSKKIGANVKQKCDFQWCVHINDCNTINGDIFLSKENKKIAFLNHFGIRRQRFKNLVFSSYFRLLVCSLLISSHFSEYFTLDCAE